MKIETSKTFAIFSQMTSRIFGPVDACAILKDARTDQTLNRRTSSVGSGPPTAKSSQPPTGYQMAGDTIRGARLGTKSRRNQTTPSSISTGRTNPACLSWTTFTATASHGTTLPATTKSPSSAKTARSCSTTSQPPTKAFAYNLINFRNWYFYTVQEFRKITCIYDIKKKIIKKKHFAHITKMLGVIYYSNYVHVIFLNV